MAGSRFDIRRIFGGAKPTRPTPMRAQGVSGFAVYGGYLQSREKKAVLTGQQRYTNASEMLSNISIVAAGVRYFLNMTAKPKWKADPVDDSDEAKMYAEFVEEIIASCDTSWSKIVRRGALYRFHGFGFQEWTAVRRPDGKIGLAKIAVRPQHTIEKWDTTEAGEILGVVQRAPQDGHEIYLPRRKLIYLVDDAMTDSPEGLGWWRQLVDPSERIEEYLRLEKVGYQRDLSGIPIGRAPIAEINAAIGTPIGVNGETFTEEMASEMIKGLDNFVKMETKDDTTGMLLDSTPYQDISNDGTKTTSVMKWGIDLLTGKAESIEYLGKAIERETFSMARIMGIENMLTGSNGVGSNALAQDKSSNFYLQIDSTISDMAEVYDRDLIDPIWALNGFPDEMRPTLKAEDIAFKDVEQVTTALRDMATAGAVMAPDDPAIDDVRDLMGISRQPEMTAERAAMLNPAPSNQDIFDPSGTAGKEPLKKFNPDQPRDDNGMWTDGGGGDSKLPDTIEINGKQRPTKNANGEPIGKTTEEVENFYQWFGESKAVDGDGKPLVFYHGSTAEFDAFTKESEDGYYGKGIYFATDKGAAERFGARGNKPVNMYEVYLSAKNPADIQSPDFKAYDGKRAKELHSKGFYRSAFSYARRDDGFDPEKAGFDGLLADSEYGGKEWIVYDAKQIKSTNNSGLFDPKDNSFKKINSAHPCDPDGS